MTTPAAKFVVRQARASEADLLSGLAMRSKAHWGYDSDFMNACKLELAFQANRISGENSRCICKVASSSETIAGFYLVEQSSDQEASWDLEALFVEPKCIGGGIFGQKWPKIDVFLAILGHFWGLVHINIG